MSWIENWFEKVYFDSKIFIFTVHYETGVSYLTMTTEIFLGPVSLLLNFDRFSTVNIECVTSKSENKISAIQNHFPTFKILNKIRNEKDETSRKNKPN